MIFRSLINALFSDNFLQPIYIIKRQTIFCILYFRFYFWKKDRYIPKPRLLSFTASIGLVISEILTRRPVDIMSMQGLTLISYDLTWAVGSRFFFEMLS